MKGWWWIITTSIWRVAARIFRRLRPFVESIRSQMRRSSQEWIRWGPPEEGGSCKWYLDLDELGSSWHHDRIEGWKSLQLQTRKPRQKKLNLTEEGEGLKERDWREPTFFASTPIHNDLSKIPIPRQQKASTSGTMQTLHRPTWTSFNLHPSSRLFSKTLVKFKIDFTIQY